MNTLDQFREDTRQWLADNCPPGARGPGQVPNGSSMIEIEDPDVRLWLDRMIEKCWTVPTWPKKYGGGGLSTAEYMILLEEMRAIRARPPLMNRGIEMVGPTLLEVGTEDQKQRYLPGITRGEGMWCQGYSEPGAGSDLASLRTTAVLDGDHFVINGQKMWTSDAHTSDWMFLLVRTDTQVPKHEGISFLLMSMHQPGITIKRIRMISDHSHFCETFFDDAIASKNDLIGGFNQGWAVGKRLLQHERSGMEALVSGGADSAGSSPAGLVETARQFVGESQGRIADTSLRDHVLRYQMTMRAFQLTQKRTVEESMDGKAPGATSSIFKTVGSELEQDYCELMCGIRGTRGYGWEGEGFAEEEVAATRRWLDSRAASIYSGSNEIQRNIIAKRVLGLPD
jgi:alkylation response protein AidB-like acyl-CoA dehydrogenase